MLSISGDAARLVRTLTHDANLPDEAGMRIVIDPKHRSLSMELARNPEPQDEIINSNGAHVFLSQPASRRLELRTLRAAITDRRSQFFLDG